MITANQLRIGNKLYYDNISFKRIFTVKNIYENSILHYDDDYNNHITLDKLEPIPLSPEILLKCGFTKDNYGIFYINLNRKNCLWIKKYQGTWQICIGEGIDNLIQMASYKNLHQLQNLYWCLCGEELNIKL